MKRLGIGSRAVVFGLVATVLLGTASAAQETPGLTFDVSITTDDTSASAGTQTGRGWIAGKHSRIDMRGPADPRVMVPGMSSSNMSVIVHDSAGAQTIAMLDHEKKKFTYPAKMMEQLRQRMASMPDKPRFSVKVANLRVDSLGQGETISGFATKRFRLSADLTMSVEMMGESMSETMHIVSEGDYAEELSDFVDPLQSSRALDLFASGTPGIDSLASVELSKLAAARPRGLPLRQTERVTGVTESGSAPPVMVTTISNIRREPVSAVIFAIPEGYTELEMPELPGIN